MQEAIVECSEGMAGATSTILDLGQPDTDVDSQAEGMGMEDVVLGGEPAMR